MGRLTFISLVIAVSLSLFRYGNTQPVVELVLDPKPEQGTIYVNPASREDIKIYTQFTGKWKQLSWEFRGPGTFQNTEFGGIYYPPAQIQGISAQVRLTITVRDYKEGISSEEIVFAVMNLPTTPTPFPTSTPIPTPTLTPTPTPTPTPTVTPTPTPTPTPTATLTPTPTLTPTLTPEPTATPIPIPTTVSTIVPEPTITPEPTVVPTPTLQPMIEPTVFTPQPTPTLLFSPTPSLPLLEQYLQNGKTYFQKKWYTTPQGKNAFDEYKAALGIDPENSHARQGIYEILRKYKFWADSEYRKGNNKEARTAYQRYLLVADYLLSTFGDEDLQEEVRIIRERLE